MKKLVENKHHNENIKKAWESNLNLFLNWNIKYNIERQISEGITLKNKKLFVKVIGIEFKIAWMYPTGKVTGYWYWIKLPVNFKTLASIKYQPSSAMGKVNNEEVKT